MIRAGQPRSGFPVSLTARRHLLIAGGIGVTAILSHARAHARAGRPCEVHYVARKPAHLDDFTALPQVPLHLYPGRQPFLDGLGRLLTDQPLGTHLYICGPNEMIDEVMQTAREAFWTGTRLHSERFGASEGKPGQAYDVVLKRSGLHVTVPPGERLLDMLEARGLRPACMCRQGLCGDCRVSVLRGEIDHRDEFLSEEERRAGTSMLICISRGIGEIELDL